MPQFSILDPSSSSAPHTQPLARTFASPPLIPPHPPLPSYKRHQRQQLRCKYCYISWMADPAPLSSLPSSTAMIAGSEDYEAAHVHEVYQHIAPHFSATRFKVCCSQSPIIRCFSSSPLSLPSPPSLPCLPACLPACLRATDPRPRASQQLSSNTCRLFHLSIYGAGGVRSHTLVVALIAWW